MTLCMFAKPPAGVRHARRTPAICICELHLVDVQDHLQLELNKVQTELQDTHHALCSLIDERHQLRITIQELEGAPAQSRELSCSPQPPKGLPQDTREFKVGFTVLLQSLCLGCLDVKLLPQALPPDINLAPSQPAHCCPCHWLWYCCSWLTCL
jgi:hypothetical protein